MTSITRHLSDDHRRCDEYFAEAETSASKGDWEQANARFSEFVTLVESHFAIEEKVLFPAFEQAVSSRHGPTAVMRTEHEQIRALLESMMQALNVRDRDAFLGNAETANTMIQQHNMKEESILYVMSDRVLAGQQVGIIEAMQSLASAT